MESKLSAERRQEILDAADYSKMWLKGEPRKGEILRGTIEALDALEAAEAQLVEADEALRNIRVEIVDSLSCEHPSDDGSDDCADVDNCLMHGIMSIVDALLPSSPEASPRSEGSAPTQPGPSSVR